MDDVQINKAAIVERCIARIREEYDGLPATLVNNQTKQDSIILNIQRACEAAVDLAMHRVRIFKLGMPQQSREAFDLLAKAGKLDPDLAQVMKRMVGFRNIAFTSIRRYPWPLSRPSSNSILMICGRSRRFGEHPDRAQPGSGAAVSCRTIRMSVVCLVV